MAMSKPKAEPKRKVEATDPESLDGKAERIRRAYRKTFGDDAGWPTEVYADAVIVDHEGEFKRFPVSIDGDDVTFGEPSPVEPVGGYKPVAEAEVNLAGESTVSWRPPTTRLHETRSGRIIESLDAGEGRKWRVKIIAPGMSKNRTRYSKQVLAEAATLYEGAKAFDGHRSLEERRSSRLGRMVGWYDDVAPAEDGSLVGTLNLTKAAESIRQIMLSAWEADRPDMIGFSHDIAAYTATISEAGQTATDVKKIAEVYSVDTVADPSAGGRLERLVASRQEGDHAMKRDEVIALLDEDEALATAVKDHLTAGATPAVPDPAPAVTESITEAAVLDGYLLRSIIREAVNEHAGDMPDAQKERIRASLGKTPTTEAEVVVKVKEAAELWAAVAGSEPGTLPGQKPAVDVTENQETLANAFDGMFAGEKIGAVTPFRSLREAYRAVTGHTPKYGDTEDEARQILAEAVEAFASTEHRRLSESITSGSWASALGDSITRRAIAEYGAPRFGDWRKLCSEIVPVNDFRTQRRDRVGYYNVLSDVPESGTYPALTSPDDEEATYAVTKKGGTEDLTLETITNDNLGKVRQIPRKLGRSAQLTLARAIFIDILQANITIYDSVALFHAGSHGNTSALAVATAGSLNTARNAIMTQTVPGETSGVLGAIPKYLAHPPELFEAVHGLLNPAPGRTTDTPWYGLEPLEVPLWTDADDWVLVAEGVPTIEVGFLNGREEPEIIIQDAPASGSVFTADKITYKVRHIWGAGVLDYRGFYKGTQ